MVRLLRPLMCGSGGTFIAWNSPTHLSAFSPISLQLLPPTMMNSHVKHSLQLSFSSLNVSIIFCLYRNKLMSLTSKDQQTLLFQERPLVLSINAFEPLSLPMHSPWLNSAVFSSTKALLMNSYSYLRAVWKPLSETFSVFESTVVLFPSWLSAPRHGHRHT